MTAWLCILSVTIRRQIPPVDAHRHPVSAGSGAERVAAISLSHLPSAPPATIVAESACALLPEQVRAEFAEILSGEPVAGRLCLASDDHARHTGGAGGGCIHVRAIPHIQRLFGRYIQPLQ